MLNNFRKLFTAVLSVMSKGDSMEQSLNNGTTDKGIIPMQANSSSEKLANLVCNPFCDTSSHPVPDALQIEILNKNEKIKRYFNRETFKDIELYRSRAPKDPEYVPLCDTLIHSEQPSAAMDVHGKKHFLLNPRMGEYAQKVDVESCKGEDLPCTQISDDVSPGTATRCETQFFRRGMVAVNTESLETYEIVVRVASGCNCFIQKTVIATN